MSRHNTNATHTYFLDTASGNRVNLLYPDPATISLADIAGALSKLCRFGGHSTAYYSVAQHSVLVKRIVEAQGFRHIALAALHHDSHEAFVCDLPSPLKKVLIASDEYRTYAALRHRFDEAIGTALGLSPELSVGDRAEIARADSLAFRMEAARLLANGGKGAIADHGPTAGSMSVVTFPPLLGPAEAEREFIVTHETLVKNGGQRGSAQASGNPSRSASPRDPDSNGRSVAA